MVIEVTKLKNKCLPHSPHLINMLAMRTDVFSIAVFTLLCSSIFSTSKPYFRKPDGISLTLMVKEHCSYMNETFIKSSLFVNCKKSSEMSFTRKRLFILLLLICGDIETCPGPVSIPLANLTRSRGLSILHQNIRGLFKNLDNLQPYFTPENNVDIFSFSETLIKNQTPMDDDNLYAIRGFNFVKRNRTNGEGGGVALYISDKLSFIRRSDLETSLNECIWIEIVQTKAKNILIGCICRPPDSSLYIDKNFNDHLNITLTKNQ